MAIATAPIYVPAPNPVIPRYGLFDCVTGPLDLPVHARIGGLQYEIGSCTLPVGYAINCISSHASKSFNGGIVTNNGYPFVVYAGIQCGVVGLANWGQERIRKFLFEQLTAGEQSAVENIFSTSAFDQTLGLANNPNTVNLGVAEDIVDGVSQLENWLYSRYGLPGVLHIPMVAAAFMTRYKQASKRMGPNDALSTGAGTLVSFGNYAGVNVTGGIPPTGSTYIYITGQVAVYRTPDSELLDVPLAQIINRTTNLVDIVMEREYIVTFDCFSAGIQVPLTSAPTGV